MQRRASKTTSAKIDFAPREGMGRWLGRIQRLLRNAQAESMSALLAAVDARDSYTRSHSITVAMFAGEIGKRMGLSASARRTLEASALLHDIGKIGVPDVILNKPGRLTEAESRIMKRHPETAVEILESIGPLGEHRRIILHHHERYDGEGYPCGLRGEEIPLGSRIIAVADAIDTMLSRRSYKAPLPVAQVRRELVEQAGVQFDPAVVSVALGWLDDGGHEL